MDRVMYVNKYYFYLADISLKEAQKRLNGKGKIVDIVRNAKEEIFVIETDKNLLKEFQEIFKDAILEETI